MKGIFKQAVSGLKQGLMEEMAIRGTRLGCLLGGVSGVTSLVGGSILKTGDVALGSELVLAVVFGGALGAGIGNGLQSLCRATLESQETNEGEELTIQPEGPASQL